MGRFRIGISCTTYNIWHPGDYITDIRRNEIMFLLSHKVLWESNLKQ